MTKGKPGPSDNKAALENSVRAAAIAAARGVPLSEAFLARVVADTSDDSLSAAERVLRASTMAEQYVASPKPLNELSATPLEIAAQNAAAGFGGTRNIGLSSNISGGNTRSGGNGSYQMLGHSDPRSLQSLTSTNFSTSPFAAVGLDFGTLSYLRAQDRSFTAQNVLNAANDAKALGFNPKDRAAMFDHTTIDRYDSKARATNKALKDYQERVEGDEELSNLDDKLKYAKTPEERKTIKAEIAEKRAHHADESGLSGRITDPANHPKAAAATGRRKTAIEKKAEEKYDHRAAHEGSAKPTDQKANKTNADVFKKLTATSPK